MERRQKSDDVIENALRIGVFVFFGVVVLRLLLKADEPRPAQGYDVGSLPKG